MRALLTFCAAGVAVAGLAACASDETSTAYGYNRYDRPAYSSYDACRRAQGNNEVAGAVVGGGVGALAGSAIAGHGDRTAGAVIGGVAGAVVGSQVGKSGSTNCEASTAAPYYDTSRVYYDENGRAFYYDASGRRYYP